MKINGINGANTQIGGMNMMQSNDSVSKNLQSQIANPQKQLQELSANKEMSLEEKMKSIIGTRVCIHRKNKDKGKIEIEYYSKEDLERIIELFEGIPSL